MNSEERLVYSIKPTWNAINDMREDIKAKLINRNVELAESCMMVASELCENALKYGKAAPNKNFIDMQVSISDAMVRIEVSNAVVQMKDLENVEKHLEKISQSDNIEQLYIQRLKELMENPRSSESQLGLYRISYEGRFKIKCDYKNNVLTMIAERKLQ